MITIDVGNFGNDNVKASLGAEFVPHGIVKDDHLGRQVLLETTATLEPAAPAKLREVIIRGGIHPSSTHSTQLHCNTTETWRWWPPVVPRGA